MATMLLPKLVKGDERIMPKTEVQRFLEEEREYTARRQALIDKVLTEREAIVQDYDEQLRALGYHANGSAPTSRRRRTISTSRTVCKICGFQTDPPHGAISHGQRSKVKAPFTAAQLRERGLTRVGELVAS
jgi:hypothetical protein